MTFRYTKLDDGEELDGSPRYEIDDTHGFTVCIVDNKDTARVFCAAPALLRELARMVETFAPGHESDFDTFGLDHFKVARVVVAQATCQVHHLFSPGGNLAAFIRRGSHCPPSSRIYRQEECRGA